MAAFNACIVPECVKSMTSPLVECDNKCGKQLHIACTGISRRVSMDEAKRYLRILCTECNIEAKFESRLKKLEELAYDQSDKLDQALTYFKKLKFKCDLNESNLLDLEKSIVSPQDDGSNNVVQLKQFMSDCISGLKYELVTAINDLSVPLPPSQPPKLDISPLERKLDQLTASVDELVASQVTCNASLSRLESEMKNKTHCSLPENFTQEVASAIAVVPLTLANQDMKDIRDEIYALREHFSPRSETVLETADSIHAEFLVAHEIDVNVLEPSPTPDEDIAFKTLANLATLFTDFNHDPSLASMSVDFSFFFSQRTKVNEQKKRKRNRNRNKKKKGQQNTQPPPAAPLEDTHVDSDTAIGSAEANTDATTDQKESRQNHCWVFLSGFNNMISTEQVLNYARHKLDCSDVDGHMLLPRGTNVLSRRKLSFKLKVPISMEEKIMYKTMWPAHIKVRKFYDDKDFFASRQSHHRPRIANQPQLKPILHALNRVVGQTADLLSTL